MSATTVQPGEPELLPSLLPGAPGSPLRRVFRAARPVGGRLLLAAFLGRWPSARRWGCWRPVPS